MPALAFGIEGVGGQRGFAGTGKACDDNQLVSRDIQVDVLQVMGESTDDVVMFHNASLWENVHYMSFGWPWLDCLVGQESRQLRLLPSDERICYNGTRA